MAEAVEDAIHDERHLFVEAGTGTGKTLAYLVPAVLSGRRVIVSTATRALQDQIFMKDLTLVAEAVAGRGVRFQAALMKGLSNYLCIRRMNEARSSRSLDPAFARILDWASETHTGDRAELGDLPEDSDTWRDVASSSDTRIGTPCPHFEECFITRMRRGAESAQIIVVNHHLFLADLALRSGPRGAHATILPAYDAVVFDEAHAIEDIATDFFGVRVSSARVEALVRDAERSLAAANALEPLKSGPVRMTLEGIREVGKSLFATLAQGVLPGDARRVLSETDVTGSVRGAHEALDLRLEALESVARGRPEDALQLVARRASDLRDDLRGILCGAIAGPDGEVGDVVRWIEVRARSVSLGASPVDIGGRLRTSLFDRIPTVVCTSATLATGNSFHFVRARLGAPPESRELVVASPFDFPSRSLLYLPDDLPEPSDPSFGRAAADRIAALVAMTGGGAFVLCTSTQAMKSLHGRLRGAISGPLMLQGERPKHLLLERFRADGSAVLVATMSFWEGVDVPGWALRLVVLDKIPFAPPNDPIVAARCATLDREGGSGFAQYSVPCAATALKQGFGRLIRTQRDAGIVAILDGRIVRRGYGRALLEALPPARRVRTLDGLRSEWGRLAAFHDAIAGSARAAEDPASEVGAGGAERDSFVQSDLGLWASVPARASD